jgi:A/G-specific adenine glycosylase
LRHAITVTNYYVRVVRLSERESRRRLPARDPQRRWIKTSELGEMPLTGLARKVLQRLQVMPVLDFLPSQEG